MKITVRQLKRLIKEAIGDNESITAEYNNPISLLSNFKTTKFENFIVDYSKHFMELENDTKRVSIKIPDEYTLEFQFYDYEFSEDPITVVEAKYAHPTRESGRMNLHTTYTNDEIESVPWIPDGTALESRIEQLVYDFLTS